MEKHLDVSSPKHRDTNKAISLGNSWIRAADESSIAPLRQT